MRKFKEIMNTPITWGGYTKFVGISSLISVAVCAAFYGPMVYEYVIQPWWEMHHESKKCKEEFDET